MKLPAIPETPPFNWMEFLHALLHFRREVNRICLGIAPLSLPLHLPGFDLFEITQLIQAADAGLPKALAEEIAFIDKKLAANNLVADS